MVQAKLQFDNQKILEYLNLPIDKSGNIKCCCPIHLGDNPHAFSYNEKLGVWKCWTHNCHEKYGSGMVGLVSAIKKISKKEAFALIKKVQGGKIEYTRKTDVDVFIENFKVTNESNLDFSSIAKNNSGIVKYFEDLKISDKTIKAYEAFLYKKDPNNPLWGRACLPIHNINDQIVGFVGRETSIINSNMKWILAPKGIEKSEYFFGMKQAKSYIYNTNEVILVEGAKDVMQMYDFNFKNVLGIFGNRVSRNQITCLISLLIKKIYIMLDPDTAGINGSELSRLDLSNYFEVINLTPKLLNDPGKSNKEDIEKIYNECTKN